MRQLRLKQLKNLPNVTWLISDEARIENSGVYVLDLSAITSHMGGKKSVKYTEGRMNSACLCRWFCNGGIY